MSLEMQIFYHTINSIVTTFYYVCQLILLSGIVDHKKHIIKTFFIYAGLFGVTYIMTESSVMITIKAYIEMLYIIVMYRLFLTKKAAIVGIYVICFWLFCVTAQENLIMLFCKIFHINPLVEVGRGVQLGKARIIFISSLFMFLLTLLMKQLLKQFTEIVEEKKLWFLVIAGCIVMSVSDLLKEIFMQQAEGADLVFSLIATLGIMAVGIMLYMFSARSVYLEQRQSAERFKMEALEKQFVYYQEKQKEEEKVRSIYHDMKNHLLVLEHQIHSPETAEMVEKLQREMESYADYMHTGNDFLDVIIKEKAEIAREKHIEFSAVIDMHGMDFIEPLDISTIFGNGLDNALEASEKLPDGQGVIVVKVGRMQDFLSILMENRCLEESVTDRKHPSRKEGGSEKKVTSKEDEYLHGFGISNMKYAAEKYGGQLTTKWEAGKFTLKILIPIP